MNNLESSIFFRELLEIRNRKFDFSELNIKGVDPFFKTPFRVGEISSHALGFAGVTCNDIWELRTGDRQEILVDLNLAAATLRTIDYVSVKNGDSFESVPYSEEYKNMIAVTQPWETKDGRWFLPHFNLPNLQAKVINVLKCEYTPNDVARAVKKWNAQDLEDEIARVGACGGIIRTQNEWLNHPQGMILANQPVIHIERIDNCDVTQFKPNPKSPLDGVRVLDMTRILAGPVAGKALAEAGADVLMVAGKHLPQSPEHVRDTSYGKRSCFLDFRDLNDLAIMKELVADSDVFVDGYRSGRFANYGLSADDVISMKPGIVHLQVSCFGPSGPWKTRAGWEQVAQAVTGVCVTHGAATNNGKPTLVTVPLCDYTTGFLGAIGVMLALHRRATEGGSYKVHVSLCSAAMATQRHGLHLEFNNAPEKLSLDEYLASAVISETTYGKLRSLGPVVKMSKTPWRWERPTPQFGGDMPTWLKF